MAQGPGQDSPEVTSIYTDGACSGNPGPGGWGAIAYFSDGQVHEMGGSAKETTNNRMELQAAIEILQWFTASPQKTPPTLYIDSKYVQDGITKWIKGWKKKQWKTSAGKPVLNQDLWKQLDQALQTVNTQLSSPLRWQYVKGHAGNTGNERCDAIARGFAQGRPPALAVVPSWKARSANVPPPMVQKNGGLDGAIDNSQASLPDPVQPIPVHSIPVHSIAPDVSPRPEVSTMSQPIQAAPPGANSPNQSAQDIVNSMTDLQSTPLQTPLQQMIDRLRVADELATHGFWVTTAELAHVVELSASTINGKGDRWLWRNWSIVRVQQESSPILWQLSRID
ncbi:MAG: ribonuclease HI [Leptolyngbyaceae cyanobacterium]